jgi:acyl-CoA thioesterase
VADSLPAAGTTAALGAFDRDTAVRRVAEQSAVCEDGAAPMDGERRPSDGPPGERAPAPRAGAPTALFEATVSPDWRAGRGPHGGYIAAMLLRALVETVADPARAPRSLTVHYPRAPEPGPVDIRTVVEREGRSLSTLSARMEQDGKLIALVLAAFSVPWSAPEIADLPMPDVAPPDAVRETSRLLHEGAPQFVSQLVLQPRLGTPPFSGSEDPMEIGAWLGTRDPRPIDALALALFSDALFSPPFIRLSEPAVTPTVDLTIHFRARLPLAPDPDPAELCFARFHSAHVHEGFFEEDGAIWAADGTLLAQSRQLGIVMPLAGR